MCTVTYLPVGDGFMLTSNRDEQQLRPHALEPHVYKGRTGALLFPKDRLAGGTWFAAHKNGTVCVLLNGADRKHQPHPPYRRSRGLILLDIIDREDALEGFYSMDLLGIEPFTLVLVQAGKLYECRWDGAKRAVREPDPLLPRIWSSATLYMPETIRQRGEWFKGWLEAHLLPDLSDVMNMHRDPFILMKRGVKMQTVSITAWESSTSKMHYMDLAGRDLS